MSNIRIFISSVQREFAQERKALRDFLQNDPLLRRFFDVFLFEDIPASDRRPDALYLEEVKQSDLYVGLFGNDYGFEDAEGISPTEREYYQATTSGIHRLIFVKGTDDNSRHPKMQTLIQKTQAELIRKRFNTSEELVTTLYEALVEYLDSKDLVRSGPFDAAPCLNASLDDLDPEEMAWFIRMARSARAFPLPENTSTEELLTQRRCYCLENHRSDFLFLPRSAVPTFTGHRLLNRYPPTRYTKAQRFNSLIRQWILYSARSIYRWVHARKACKHPLPMKYRKKL